MSYSLISHEHGYRITFRQGLLSIATGFSGIPYAKRHWSLSNIDKQRYCGHRTIAVLEALPVLGGVISIFEKVSVVGHVSIFNKPHIYTNFFKRPSEEGHELSQGDYVRKLQKNFEKAINEHKKCGSSSSYATVDKAIKSIRSESIVPLTFEDGFYGEKGMRDAMEDYHSYFENEQRVLVGVFDGHGGREVSHIASQNFQRIFFNKLARNNGNVRASFEDTINKIHDFVVERAKIHTSYYTMGSTVVVSYINKETNEIYTVTLGDSEANIYRKLSKEIKSIPLSCVRDWASKKDVKRAAEALEDESIIDSWPKFSPYRKKVNCRVGFDPRDTGYFWNVNVSRAIGDVDNMVAPNGTRGVIQKPKITVHKVKKGDILILACDGLKDFVPENKIIELLSNVRARSSREIARSLVNYAYYDYASDDNISVLAVKIT